MKEALEILHDALNRWGEKPPGEFTNFIPTSVSSVVQKKLFCQHLKNKGNAETRQQVADRINKLKKHGKLSEYSGLVWAIH